MHGETVKHTDTSLLFYVKEGQNRTFSNVRKQSAWA
jgi:hypothetical protein